MNFSKFNSDQSIICAPNPPITTIAKLERPKNPASRLRAGGISYQCVPTYDCSPCPPCYPWPLPTIIITLPDTHHSPRSGKKPPKAPSPPFQIYKDTPSQMSRSPSARKNLFPSTKCSSFMSGGFASLESPSREVQASSKGPCRTATPSQQSRGPEASHSFVLPSNKEMESQPSKQQFFSVADENDHSCTCGQSETPTSTGFTLPSNQEVQCQAASTPKQGKLSLGQGFVLPSQKEVQSQSKQGPQSFYSLGGGSPSNSGATQKSGESKPQDEASLKNATLRVSVAPPGVALDNLDNSEPNHLIELLERQAPDQEIINELTHFLQSPVSEFELPYIEFDPRHFDIMTQYEIESFKIILQNYEELRTKLFYGLLETKKMKETIQKGSANECLIKKYGDLKAMCVVLLRQAITIGFKVAQFYMEVKRTQQIVSMIDKTAFIQELAGSGASQDFKNVWLTAYKILQQVKALRNQLNSGCPDDRTRMKLEFSIHRKNLEDVLLVAEELTRQKGEEHRAAEHYPSCPSACQSRQSSQNKSQDFRVEVDIEPSGGNASKQAPNLQPLTPKMSHLASLLYNLRQAAALESPDVLRLLGIDAEEEAALKSQLNSYFQQRRKLLNNECDSSPEGSRVNHLLAIEAPSSDVESKDDLQMSVEVVPQNKIELPEIDVFNTIPTLVLEEASKIEDASVRGCVDDFNRSYKRGRELQNKIKKRKELEQGRDEDDQESMQLADMLVSLMNHRTNMLAHQIKLTAKNRRNESGNTNVTH